MDGQCLLSNTVLPSKFDGLNFEGLAGKHQNCQNFPRQNFPLYSILIIPYGFLLKHVCV